MVTLRRSVTPLEEASDIGGMAIASTTRASSLCMATLNKWSNNPLAHLATDVMQGLKVKLYPRPASTMPVINLRQKINNGHDARRITEARRRDHPNRYHDDNDNDCFPAFTSNITEKSYPKDFKPVGIPTYDGKQDPRQWIRCYSIAIEVLGGSNSTKALYFLVALESAPLTWLESLKPNSIDSWGDLKRAFIDNF
jgi:hypothetical protein